MESSRRKFTHSKLFTLVALVVYVYSFIQLEAYESPIKVDLVQLDDPFMMKKIQLEVCAPMKIIVRIFGKDEVKEPAIIDGDHTTSD